MKKIAILFLFLLSGWFTYGQEVTIGTGTISQSYPLSNYYGYQRSAALYTATEIGQAGFITQLAWDVGATGANRPVKIYLKEVDSATLTAATWETLINNALPVYSGVFEATSTGYRTITLDRSFNYSGGNKNLVVLVEANFGASGTDDIEGLSIKATAATNLHLAKQVDYNPPTETLDFESNRPNIKIGFGTETASCQVPFSIITNVGNTSVTFDVIGMSTTALSVQYEVRTTGAAGSGATGLAVSGTVSDLTTLPFEITGLAENTNYSLYVKGLCSQNNVTAFSEARTFTTRVAGVIGTGVATSGNLPIVSNYGYNYSQMIYTANEVAGVVNDLRLIDRVRLYYAQGTSDFATYNKWTIYMGNTSQSNFPSSAISSWIDHSSLSQVFSGTVDLSMPANRWVEIVLDQPFAWDGTSNLVFSIFEDSPGFSFESRFRTFATTENRGMIKYQDDVMTAEQATMISSPSVYRYVPQLFLGGIETPECYQPIGLNATTVTDSSFQLNWQFLEGTTNNGSEYYISTSNTVPTGATVPTGIFAQDVVTTNIEELDENTTYYVFIRTICTDGSKSEWTSALRVTTKMVPASIPFSDDFGPDSSYVFANAGFNKWFIGTAVNNGGTHALYISNTNGETNVYNFSQSQVSHVYKDFIIPTEAEEIEIQFDWRSVGDPYDGDGFTVWVVPTTFQPIAGGDITTATNRIRLGRTLYNQNATFVNERFVLDASAYAGQTVRLVFQWKNNSWDGTNPPAAIDNLKINYSTCLQPQDLVVDQISATSIKANWDAVEGVSNYEVKITTTPSVPAESVAGTTVSATTHTFADLTSNTSYYIWVRSLCSTTNKSLWTGPLRVTTALIPVDLPYRDGFEADQNYAMVNAGLNKWHIGTAVNYGGQRSLYISGDEGVTNVYLNNNRSQVSHTYKDFNIPTGAVNLGVNFDWRSLGNYGDYFRVWLVPVTYSPVAGIQTTTGNSGGVRLGASSYYDSAVFKNERIVFDGSAYAGQTMRLVFEWVNDTWGEYQPPAAIDNLEFSVITCADPTNVQVTAVTSDSVTLSWTAAPGQNQYEIYHSTQNVGLVGNTVTGSATTTNNTYTVQGLTQNTQYYFWVRTICSPTSKSFWVPVSAFSGQIPGELPYEDNFEGENNWSFITNSINQWVVGRAVSNGGLNSLYISKDNGATNTYDGSAGTVAHAYRDLAIPAGAALGSLKFDWRAVGEGSIQYPSDYMKIWLVPASFRPTLGQQIPVGTDRVRIGNIYNRQENFTVVLESIDLAPFAGSTLRLVFEWINDTYSASDPPAAIDNVRFKLETCPAVTGLSACAGADRINYGWDSQEGMTQWEIAFQTTDAEEPETANIQLVDEPNYSATGLTVNTNYYFYVRNVCEGDDYSMWKKINVKTNSSSILDAEPFCAGPEGIIFPNNHRGNTPVQYPLGEGLSIACLSSVPYPVWYFLKIDQEGELIFDIVQAYNFDANGEAIPNPNGGSYDVDFVAFGPFDTLDQACAESVLGPCPGGCFSNWDPTDGTYPIGNIVDCNYSTATIETLTIRNAVRGQIYAILITNYGGDPGFIKLVQKNVNEQGAGKTDCKFLCEVDLGPDQYLCPGTGSYEITAKISTAGSTEDMIYTWYKDGELMDPAVFNMNRLTVTETGTYSVHVEKDICEENPEDEVFIKFYDEIELNIPAQIELCDVDNVGYADFEVKAAVEQALASHPESETLLHAYYETLEDAQAGTNPIEIGDLYRSPGGNEIFIVVSRDKNEDCRKIFRILLDIKPTVYFNAEFSYDAPICINNLDELPITPGAEFTLGGGFTYKAISDLNGKEMKGGLVLNSETGTINVAKSKPGIYEITYNYAVPAGMCGEPVQHSEKITIYDRFEIEFDGDCYNGKYYLRVNDVLGNINMDKVIYSWSGPGGFTGDSREVSVPGAGEYTVFFQTQDGCYESLTIKLEEEQVNCMITKGISPNGDGLNDYFDLSNYDVKSFKVFNRNGGEVFSHGKGYTVEWKGQDKSGNKLPVGTYFYVIETAQTTITGWVQLNY